MAAADAAVHVDIHNRTLVHERVAGQSRFIIAKQIAFKRNSTFHVQANDGCNTRPGLCSVNRVTRMAYS